MTAQTARLRYDGAATLTFRDGSGARRTAYHGIEFETDAETAEALLASDPAIHAVDDDGDVETQPDGYAAMSHAALKAEAKRRDLSQAGKKEALVTRLEEHDRAQETAQPHPSSSEAEAGAEPPPGSGEINEDTTGTDATGKTPGGPESAQVGTAGAAGTTSAEAPRSGAVTLGDIPESGRQRGS